MTTQTIEIAGIPVIVETEVLSTIPPALRTKAYNGEVAFVETLTLGPNNPSTPTSPGDLQGYLDAFRQQLAQKVVTQLQLMSMVNQLQ